MILFFSIEILPLLTCFFSHNIEKAVNAKNYFPQVLDFLNSSQLHGTVVVKLEDYARFLARTRKSLERKVALERLFPLYAPC